MAQATIKFNASKIHSEMDAATLKVSQLTDTARQKVSGARRTIDNYAQLFTKPGASAPVSGVYEAVNSEMDYVKREMIKYTETVAKFAVICKEVTQLFEEAETRFKNTNKAIAGEARKNSGSWWKAITDAIRFMQTVIDSIWNRIIKNPWSFVGIFKNPFIQVGVGVGITSIVIGILNLPNMPWNKDPETQTDQPKPETPPLIHNPKNNVDTIGKNWYPTAMVFKYENKPGNREKDAYNAVIDQFNVAKNSRYTKDNQTYCNMFVWDVTKAMGCEIPHFYDPKTGKNASLPLIKGQYLEMDANQMCAWLDKFGPANGWREVSAAEAQKMANAGKPVVVAQSNPGGIGHVQIGRPDQGETFSSAKGPAIAQSGLTNTNYAHANDFMLKNQPIKYYYHD